VSRLLSSARVAPTARAGPGLPAAAAVEPVADLLAGGLMTPGCLPAALPYRPASAEVQASSHPACGALADLPGAGDLRRPGTVLGSLLSAAGATDPVSEVDQFSDAVDSYYVGPIQVEAQLDGTTYGDLCWPAPGDRVTA